ACRWLLAASILFCASHVLAGDFPRTIKPVMAWAGNDNKQTKPCFARCDTPEEWAAIWQKHHGLGTDRTADVPPCPEVDFGSYMVVAILHGQFGMTTGISVREVVEEKSRLRVRYELFGCQIGAGMDSRAYEKLLQKFAETHCFAFVVLPKNSKTVVLERDERHLINGPPRWKEVVKLAANDKK